MSKILFTAVIIAAFFGLLSFIGGNTSIAAGGLGLGDDIVNKKPEGYPTAVLAGGCFWCVESEYRAINGVLHTRVGYTGGTLNNPSYRDITTGKTGHAEVVAVTYDPAQLSYEQLLEFFLTKAHDPTQLNRQGVDVGTQYRSAIFYESEEQRAQAEKAIERIEMNKVHRNKIVTTLEPLSTFWDGEEYHQQYYDKYEAQTGAPHIRMMLKMAKKKRL